jgi:hypothetical protein
MDRAAQLNIDTNMGAYAELWPVPRLWKNKETIDSEPKID